MAKAKKPNKAPSLPHTMAPQGPLAPFPFQPLQNNKGKFVLRGPNVPVMKAPTKRRLRQKYNTWLSQQPEQPEAPINPPDAGAPGNPQPPMAEPPPTGGPLLPGPGLPIDPGSGVGTTPSTDNPYANAPNLPGLFSRGPNMLGDVYSRATDGSTQSFDTAANRLRERLDAQTQANVSQAQRQTLGRGFGPSGLTGANVFRAQQAGQNAYAQGLSDLSNQFEQNRLQGLGIGLGAIGQGLQNANFMDSTLFGLLNNREGRNLQASEGQKGRDLQQRLAELAAQNENWQVSVGMGSNQYPQVASGPGLGDSIANAGGFGSNTGFYGQAPGVYGQNPFFRTGLGVTDYRR